MLDHSTYLAKPEEVRQLVLEALEVLAGLGIPLEGMTGRKLERMAQAFLAVADVRATNGWPRAKDLSQGHHLKTREIIAFENEHFAEKISSGSYDDVRRRDLLLPVVAHVVGRSSPASARNAPNRAYGLSPEAGEAVRHYGTSGWKSCAEKFVQMKGSLAEELAAKRALVMTPVTLPNGTALVLTPGEHNELQKAVLEQFLPRFGHGAQVLYLGDAANKSLYLDEETLRQLKFFELEHGELPDVVAYSNERNWIFLIEAVHSFGPISPVRRRKLASLTEKCSASVVFVTAFNDRATFRQFVPQLAWEQEVWIATEPDHLIHFNGDKFLGPYETPKKAS